MRKLVLTPKFKRTYRKFVSRDFKLKKHIEDTLRQMEQDVFAPSLSTRVHPSFANVILNVAIAQ